MDLEFFLDLAAGEDLDGVLPGRQALPLEALRRYFGAAVEAILEIGEVDRLRLGAEVLKRHRLLFVRAAELSHPHVDRVLPTLVASLALATRARAGALVTATGGLAKAAALATADPLARPFRARLRLQVVETDLLGARGAFVGGLLGFFVGFLSHRRPQRDARRPAADPAAARSP